MYTLALCSALLFRSIFCAFSLHGKSQNERLTAVIHVFQTTIARPELVGLRYLFCGIAFEPLCDLSPTRLRSSILIFKPAGVLPPPRVFVFSCSLHCVFLVCP